MKSRSSYILLVFSSIFVLSFTSCENDVKNGKEGVIHYELTYLDDENENAIITFLPSDMSYSYQDGRSIQKVEGWGGIFKMVGLSNSKNDSVVALLKLLGDKFMYTCKLGDDSFGYDPLVNITIEYVNETKVIAGYECKKAIAHHNNEDYELFYTDDINIENANWNTPFKEIKGVLLEYQIKMFSINTKITATKVEKILIDDSEFIIPDDYKIVDKKVIEETIYKFM